MTVLHINFKRCSHCVLCYPQISLAEPESGSARLIPDRYSYLFAQCAAILYPFVNSSKTPFRYVKEVSNCYGLPFGVIVGPASQQ